MLKFTNDLDKSIHYAYGATETIYNRYTKLTFIYYTTPNVYTGRIKFLPSGYWKYEAYEVSWASDSIEVGEETAPKDETEVLSPPAATKGIVQGLVTKGKMYVSDIDGTKQVTYRQHPEPSGTNYIYYGQ